MMATLPNFIFRWHAKTAGLYSLSAEMKFLVLNPAQRLIRTSGKQCVSVSRKRSWRDRYRSGATTASVVFVYRAGGAVAALAYRSYRRMRKHRKRRDRVKIHSFLNFR